MNHLTALHNNLDRNNRNRFAKVGGRGLKPSQATTPPSLK